MKITIFDIENWKEIGATLMRNKTRTFLTGFGIFWGVAMLAMLMGGAEGGEGMLRREFAGFANNSAALIPGSTTEVYKGFQKGRRWNMDLTDIQLIKEAFPNEVKDVIPMFSQGSVSMKNGKHSYSGQLNGVNPNYLTMLTPKHYSGRFFNEADVTGERKVAVIGKKVATELYPGIEDPSGRMIEINGSAYSVIGVFGDASEVQINGKIDEQAMIPTSTFRRVNGRGNNVDFAMLVANDNVKMSELLPKIRSIVYRRHEVAPDDTGAMWTMNIAEMFERVDMLFSGVDLLALFIGVSTLLAGVIGIGNIMWVIVKERTQEIGIRRAIGAKPRDIIVQVLCEGAALTLVAGLAGLVFAAIVLAVIQHKTNPADAVSVAQFQMTFDEAVTILITFIVLGMAAGLIPSIKAMRIKPIEALNSK